MITASRSFSSMSFLKSLYFFGALPWIPATSALLFSRMESSMSHKPMHSTFGCFNAFDRSPKPMLRHPIRPMRILSFADGMDAALAEKGVASIPAMPAPAIYFVVSERNCRRDDLCALVIDIYNAQALSPFL